MKKAIVVRLSEVMADERCIPFGGFMDGAERIAKTCNETGNDLADWSWAPPDELVEARRLYPDHICIVIREEKEDDDGSN